MHETMPELKMLKETKKRLSEWISCAVSEGKEGFCCEEAGAVTDMIKDLAETEEKCMKAKYYEMLIGEMMSQDEDMYELGRMGYDNWRYKSSGQFAPKGKGTYMGYRPYPPNMANLRMPQEPWTTMNPHDFMGYNGSRQNSDRNRTGRYDDSPSGIGGRMGYPMDEWGEEDRMGRPYQEYLNARRHYTESRDPEESHRMNDKILETTMETAETMGEMWRDANPETRRQMESNLTKLMDEWKRSK